MIISLLLASAVSASAQVPADLDSLARAFAAAGAAVTTVRAQAPKSQAPAAVPAPTSCADAKELETSFELTITYADGRKPVELKLAYAGCEEEGRNDYLPPYTTRSYKGQDGYALTIVTDESRAESSVLLSLGKEWVGRFGELENAKLVSGASLVVGGVELKGASKGSAVLRRQPKAN